MKRKMFHLKPLDIVLWRYDGDSFSIHHATTREYVWSRKPTQWEWRHGNTMERLWAPRRTHWDVELKTQKPDFKWVMSLFKPFLVTCLFLQPKASKQMQMWMNLVLYLVSAYLNTCTLVLGILPLREKFSIWSILIFLPYWNSSPPI